MGCRGQDQQRVLAELGHAYARALLPGDEIAAELAVRDALDAAPLHRPQIDDEIIAPALWLVGRLWARGEISIADEHLATSISLRVLALEREAAPDRAGPHAAEGRSWPRRRGSCTPSRCR